MSIHIKALQTEVAITFAAKTNALFLSKPAVGKSQETMRAAQIIADKMRESEDGTKFGIWFHDMLTATPNDVLAYMPDPITGKLVCYPNAGLPNYYDDPKLTGILVQDEVLNGESTSVKVFSKYNNGDDCGGKLRKPEGVIVIGMSNRISDKAGVMSQSRAFMSRFEQMDVVSDAKHNLAWAEAANWWPPLLKFFERFPMLIDNYEQIFEPSSDDTVKLSKGDREIVTEEGKRGVWANMRSWERISRLEYASHSFNRQLNPYRVLANVGRAVGQQYVVYRAMFDKIASVEEILKDPKGVDIPTKMDEVYVMVNMLAAFITSAQIKPASQFIDRLQGDLRAMAIRRMVKRGQRDKSFTIGSSKEFQAWMKDPSISDLFMAKG